ncbi:MAG TPA: chemotaxis protein [Ignavibacteriales bacterium]|nr:chemotaxis protein [Ignavibacteriales bacterium]
MKTNILLETGTNELEIIEYLLNYPDTDGSIKTQSFGINVAKVREIMNLPEITELPNQPPNVKGIFNLRNRIIPVIDLGLSLFNYTDPNTYKKLIVTEFNNNQFGFIVSDVKRIYRFSWMQVEAPDIINDFSTDQASIIGIIKTEDKNILLADVEKIIAEINPTLGLEVAREDIMKAEEIKKLTAQDITVVTAEDSPTIRKMITGRLNLAGFKIQAFNDGLSAWNYLEDVAKKVEAGEDLSKYVNLVITDVEMPQMDGFTLTKNIKTNKTLQSLPVIIFSSIVSEEVAHKGASVGADMQLTKPQVSILLDSINKLLGL